MGLFDFGKCLNLGNIVVGAAAVVLAPVVIPAIGGMLRPMAKAAVKGGVLMFEKGKEIAAEARETVEDLTAEVRSEMQEGHGAGASEKKIVKAKS